VSATRSEEETEVEFIQKNIWLVLIAVVSGVMFIWPFIAKLLTRTHEVDVNGAVQLINRQDAAIVDVRDAAEYKSGHIPNARNIPAGEIAERAKELEKLKKKPILLTCASGNRSASAGSGLQKAGFEQVYTLAGGMNAWQQAGMPVQKS
jgi:rhodanese-related sulfurtransferase